MMLAHRKTTTKRVKEQSVMSTSAQHIHAQLLVLQLWSLPAKLNIFIIIILLIIMNYSQYIAFGEGKRFRYIVAFLVFGDYL